MIERFMQWDREFCAKWPSPFRVIWRFKLTAITAFLASLYVEIFALGFLAPIASALDGYIWFKHEIYHNPTSKGSKLLIFRHDLMMKAMLEIHPISCRVEGKRMLYAQGLGIVFFLIFFSIIIFMIVIRINMNIAIELNRYLDFNLFPIVNKYSDELIRVGVGYFVPLQRFVQTISLYCAIILTPFLVSTYPTMSIKIRFVMKKLKKWGYQQNEILKIMIGTYMLTLLIAIGFLSFLFFHDPDLSISSHHNIAGNDVALFLLSMGWCFFLLGFVYFLIMLFAIFMNLKHCN